MVKIVMTTYFNMVQMGKIMEVGASSEIPPYPDFIKITEHVTLGDGKSEKMKAYGIYEIPDDKIVEAVIVLHKRYLFYANRVEDYSYTLEIGVASERGPKLFS